MSEKEMYLAYEEVRRSGKFNMYSVEAIEQSGLDRDDYLAVREHYEELSRKYSIEA